MNVNSINNTTFQARLDVSKVVTNKTRWQNIAKVFSEKTKGRPELMSVVEHGIDTSIVGPAKYEHLPQIGIIEAISFNTTIKDLLSKNSDEKIADKLIKLLNIGTIAEGRKEKALERCNKMIDKESWVPKDKFMNQLYNEYALIGEAALNKTNKDAFWKNFEVIV